jgi:PAS domain S-box-containing protein
MPEETSPCRIPAEPVAPAAAGQGPGERLNAALARREALDAELAALRRLHELSARLLSAGGLQPLLEEVLDAAMELQGADFGHVQLLNPQTGALDILAQRGFGRALADEAAAVQECRAPCSRALERRARVLLEDVDADPEYAPYRPVAAAAGFRAVQATPLFDRAGQPLGVFSTHFRQPHRPAERELRLTDLYAGQAAGLIERTQAEDALRASEARYRALVHATSSAVWRLSADGERQLSLEGSFARGHQELEVRPGDWLSRVHPEDRARTLEAWRQAVATQSLYEIEHRVLAADGGYRCLLSRGVPVRDANGEVLEWIGASADVTERKQAELALREREAQLAFAQRIGRVGVWGRDLVSQVSFVTPEWCDIVGVQDPTLVRSLPEFLALVHPDDRARVQAANRQATEAGIDVDLEFRILHPERGERWMLSRGRRLPPAVGHGPQLLGVIIDVTEQKRAEAALRASEERLRRAVQIDTVGVLFFKPDGRITDANDAFLRMSGCSRQELAQGRVRWDELTPPEWMPASLQAVAEFEATGRTTPYQKEYVRKDGTRWWGLFAATRVGPEEGVEFVIDVTERKQLEQEVLEVSSREQRRIGHDLHDDLCQRLGGLQLLSGVLEKELAAAGSPQALQAGRIQALVHEALERARLLARGLAPVALEEGGLAGALQELANNAAQLFHLRCEFQGEPVGLGDAGAATHLYRIAQEAITNAVKHGRAKRVAIHLADVGDRFELKVVDDGRGFARTTAARAGMGLRIMKYRAAMLGATLEVQSAPGRGTTVTCAFGKGLCGAKEPARGGCG